VGVTAEEFGRMHHLPKAQVAAVVDGLRGRGLVNAAGGFTDAGRGSALTPTWIVLILLAL
jgi:hypothetical protein